MEKREIVKKALESGLLVTPVALEKINDSNIESVLKRSMESGKIVITSKLFSEDAKPAKRESAEKKEPERPAQRPVKKTEPAPKTKIESTLPTKESPKPETSEPKVEEPVKTETPQEPEIREPVQELKPAEKLTVQAREYQIKNKLEPQDFAQFYNHKYKGLQELILKKVNAVSINKARGGFSDIAVIGMVRELTPKGFILEDPTGEIEVVNRDKIPPDDVIGIKGFVRETKLFPNEFVWPDIPLQRDFGKIPSTTILLAPKQANISGIDAVITPDRDTNPKWLILSKGEKKTHLLVFRPPAEFTLKKAVAWLKKRHLPHKKENIGGPEDPYLLVPIPDIIWFIGGKEETLVYKGVTMVSTDERFAKIDLGTMKVEFI